MRPEPTSDIAGPRPSLDAVATQMLVERLQAIRTEPEPRLGTRRALARHLGAAYDPDTGLTTFGFWAPELAQLRVQDHSVHLELFTALDPVDIAAPRQAVTFRRDEVSLVRDGDYLWGAVADVLAGGPDRLGALYRLRAVDDAGVEHIIRDLVAHSIPYGSFAPAEVYDMVSLQRRRTDLDHFAEPAPVPTSILELHVPTATASGSIGELAEVYRRIGAKLAAGEALTTAEQVYADYDAVQPLPVDPTIERRDGNDCFLVTDVVDEHEGIVGVLLRQPSNQNWGYDNIVAASSATNPSLLRSRRPDELVALAEALHAMPEPMMLVFDIVYGHADNQALDVLPSRFVKGPNMYGQDLNHQDPTVRAILLEMQRRRMNTGADGLRVDGAQDFKFYDPRTGRVEYDDDYLQAMSDIEQEIGGHTRRLFMIFEDGRPWPDEGWETSSTYRDVIEQQPDTFQWGPLIFAHNTPMLEGFWVDKWWRVSQIVEHGGHWISGCANHDTVRRGTQVDPGRPINRHLGGSLPDILDNAYDNVAATAVTYALLPGIPMDFLHATTRTPWAFMRTTDDLYGVKIMAEEGGFLDWQVRDEEWADPEVFRRVKRHGARSRGELRSLLARLESLTEETDYDLDAMALALADGTVDWLPPGRAGLVAFARHYMEDVHDLCNVARSLPGLDPDRVRVAVALRRLRRHHPWLRNDCGPDDLVERVDGEQTLYRGHRRQPGGPVVVAAVANMAGAPLEADLRDLVTADRDPSDATAAVVGPPASLRDGEVTLPDGSAVVFVWGGA